ncbi:hypothetical protein ACFL6X_00140 [Candidatus Latescibacterota bacterium]
MRQYLAELDRAGSEEAQRLERAADLAGVDPIAATAMVREIGRRALSLYEETSASTTHDLVARGRRKAGVSSEQAQALLQSLLLPAERR